MLKLYCYIIAGGINGELFAEIPEDKGELLQDLKLSPGFKRLLVKRAKQVMN